jgi:hypothetical protein
VEEELLARRPGKVLAAVDAEDRTILKLSLHHGPFSLGVGRRNLCCVNL